jgi:PAS domain S-box-containing protein
MADGAPVMIWISGLDRLCTWFNQPWLNFTGRTLEQEIGEGWAENVHAEDLDGCVQTYREAFGARRPFIMEYRLRVTTANTVDPGPRRSAARVRRKFTGYVGSCLDITERREAEERLRRAEEAARTVVENVADGIITIDAAGVIQSFNSSAERMFGYASDEVIGCKVTMLMPEPYAGRPQPRDRVGAGDRDRA